MFQPRTQYGNFIPAAAKSIESRIFMYTWYFCFLFLSNSLFLCFFLHFPDLCRKIEKFIYKKRMDENYDRLEGPGFEFRQE